MFGQWALGAEPLGEPEEFPGQPVPVVCTVWITAPEVTEAQPTTASIVDEEAF